MIGRTLGCVVVVGWLMAGGSLQAHHSLAGVYDMKGEAEVSGTLTKIQFVNPHGSLTLAVKNPDGSITEWSIVGGSVTQIARLGLGKTGPNALHVGDEITVTTVPALDGKSPIGLLRAITYADGHTVRFGSTEN